MGPERKLYQDFKKKSPQLILNRIENLSLIGMPDVLGYNKNNHFYFGPLVRGPRNLFRTACTVVQESRSLLLAACRLRLAAWGLDLRLNYSSRLVLDAWCLWLVAWSLDLDPMTKFRRPLWVTICPAPFIVQPGDDVVVLSMSRHIVLLDSDLGQSHRRSPK
jgi:hypothetical protein